METILKGRTIVKGVIEGEALVSEKPVCFVGGIDTQTGDFIEHDHPLTGVNLKGKIMVYPTGKGSTGGAYVLYEASCNGVAPAAIINNKIEQITVVGAILGEIPMMDTVQPDPVAAIKTGDWLRVNATNGVITILKRKEA